MLKLAQQILWNVVLTPTIRPILSTVISLDAAHLGQQYRPIAYL